MACCTLPVACTALVSFARHPNRGLAHPWGGFCLSLSVENNNKINYRMEFTCLNRGDVRQRKPQNKQALSWKFHFYHQRQAGRCKAVTRLPSHQLTQIPHSAFPPKWGKWLLNRKTRKVSGQSEPLLSATWLNAPHSSCSHWRIS